MKKYITAYRVFTPDMYTIFAFLVGSIILIAIGAFMNTITLPGMVIIVVSCLLSSLDVLCDYFVFQSIFSKDFAFGILANSHKGYDVLRMGVRGDQFRRFIQIVIVEFATGMILKNRMFEVGYFSSLANYLGFITIVALAVYFGNTLSLNVTRRFTNYAEGILPISLFSVLETAMIFGISMIYLRESAGSVPVMPLIVVFVILSVIATYCMCERINLRFKDSFGERKTGRFGEDSKKKMIVFLAIAFGVDFAMIPLMKYGFDRGIELSVFLVAQMMYPACGVVLAKLGSYNEGKLPKAAYVTILFLGAVCMLLSAMAVTMPMDTEVAGISMSMYYLISNYVVIVFDIFFIVFVCACGKEKRENAGFRFRKPLQSVLFMLLHIILYFTYFLIASVLFSKMAGISFSIVDDYVRVIFSEKAPILWISMMINLPLTFVMFLGEEYGWRYFFQPRMQKKFGTALGTVLLGIVWGLWHAGADFMYYSSETGPQMLAAQIVACVAMGIFFGYAYMKTGNIWVPTVMHFFNNNIVSVLSGGNTLDAMQGKVVGWNMIPAYMIAYAVMWAFIFTPTMLGKAHKVKEAENAQ
ncbi:MAG: CPBP family intramembrane metalloprotease [Lachnospiraceae bacterium]|nr:CPBP family intramembrane metalloprotease [Lachnospiraceae bacterium]